ncbi:MAG: hypothetical protein V4503_03670 [Gemmatimonadota bacterium]
MSPLTVTLALSLLAPAVHLAPAPAPRPSLAVSVDSTRHQVVLTISGVEIAAPTAGAHHAEMHAAGGEFPLLRFRWPVNGWARGASLTLAGPDGKSLPREIVHHINVVNFDRRQLFYPIAERLLAMGQETESIRLPATVGVPVSASMAMGVIGAFHNPGHTALRGVVLTLRIDYSPANLVPRPISVLPAYLDVRDPVGNDVDFDLPAGRSRFSYDFVMPLTGRIIGAGGHLHNFGTGIELLDLGGPREKSVIRLGTALARDGSILKVERALPGVSGKGIRLEGGRRYRVAGEYDNSSGQSIAHGAMVHLILLFAPDREDGWPAVATADPGFKRDTDRLEEMGNAAAMHGMPD